MNKLYTFLKYFFIVFWAVFVVAPFLWALTTSFKDFQSVNGGVTYIPWVDFEPNLEGWKVLIKSPAKGGVDIIEPYFNSLFVTCTASLISIILGTLSAYALSRYTFKAGFVKNNDITFFFISQRIMPPIVLSIPFFLFLSSNSFRYVLTSSTLLPLGRYLICRLPDFFANIFTFISTFSISGKTLRVGIFVIIASNLHKP